MSDPETPNQPLIGASNQQTAVNVGEPAHGGSSSRAYKVAGLTLLACVLIVGQSAIAYFLFSQSGDIKSLQDENNKMNTELTKTRSGLSAGSMPVRMHMPMSSMHVAFDNTKEEEESTSGKTAAPLTNCQLEAAGLKALQVPGFFPECDKNGLYKSQQCFATQCWCVNPETGLQIPGSAREGQVMCNTFALTGKMLGTDDDLEILTE
uniref:CD74 molecule, major histocompatibility complex, class II invariant chain b n=1 Tax=Iconisemion striatum TaxID=60296 RepID=A0A1A7WBW6_9TELE